MYAHKKQQQIARNKKKNKKKKNTHTNLLFVVFYNSCTQYMYIFYYVSLHFYIIQIIFVFFCTINETYRFVYIWVKWSNKQQICLSWSSDSKRMSGIFFCKENLSLRWNTCPKKNYFSYIISLIFIHPHSLAEVTIMSEMYDLLT